MMVGWLVGWGLTALLTQIRSYRAWIFYDELFLKFKYSNIIKKI